MTMLISAPQKGHDFLRTNRSAVVMIEYTSNCNLRCVYCSVSGENWVGRDLSDDMANRITEQTIKMGTELAILHGHGETTMLEGWELRAKQLSDAGISLSICSNLAKTYTEQELTVLARFKHLAVSIDTVDIALFKKLRRGGDVRHVIYNMSRIQAIARRINNPICISWSIVCTDKTVWGLEDLVELGISLGVKGFTFCNLSDHDTPKGAIEVTHVSEFNMEDCGRAIQIFANIEKMCHENDCRYDPKAGLIDTLKMKYETGTVTPVVK